MSGRVLSVMQRAESELPRGADESTRAGKSIPIETISHGDGATISPGESDYTKEIRSLGWQSYWASGPGAVRPGCGNGPACPPWRASSSKPSATTQKTRGPADWCSGGKGR